MQYPVHMLLYYITDRSQFAGAESERIRALLARIREAASAGVDYIQLREKDLPTRDQEMVAREALRGVRESNPRTRLMINSRTDVALAVGADGVHLTSTDVSASEARAIWAASMRGGNSNLTSTSWFVAVSCHSIAEVRLAESHGADCAVLAPIFEKARTKVHPLGLEVLRTATRHGEAPDRRIEAGDQRATIPVIALGGVTVENARECLRAGASGIAGIRIFQDGDIKKTVEAIRLIANG